MNTRGKAFQHGWPLLKSILLDRLAQDEVEPSTHAQEQMHHRHVEWVDVLDIVRFWSIDEMFEARQYPYGKTPFTNVDPVFSITGQNSRGKKLTIAFATQRRDEEFQFKVITVFFEDEIHGNRHQSNLDNDSL